MQAFDYVTRTGALVSGAGREANPLMGAIVGNRPAFIARQGRVNGGNDPRIQRPRIGD